MSTKIIPQPSLFNNLSGDFEIKKHSSFIQIQSKASLIQRKAMNGIIYVVKDQLNRNPNQRIFTMDLGVLKKLSGIHGTDNNQLKNALRGLATMAIEYNVLGKDKETRGVFTFLSHAQIEVEHRGKASIIKIECPTLVIEAIRRPRIYSKLNLLITRGLDSKHALVLYEVMKDYIGLGKLNIEIQELRKLFGITDDQYNEGFSMFRKRVVEAAIKEVNDKTDIHISMDEPERIGRKVIGITFRTSSQSAIKFDRIEDEKVVQKLTSFGFKEKRAVQILKKHDKEFILANIAAVEEQYLKKGKQIKSIPALLSAAFKSDFSASQNEHAKISNKKEKEKSEEREAIEAKELEEKLLREKFNAYKSELYKNRYSKLESQEIEQFKMAFQENLGAMHIASKYIERKGFDHPIVLKTFEKFMTGILLTEDERDFAVYKSSQKKESVQNLEG